MDMQKARKKFVEGLKAGKRKKLREGTPAVPVRKLYHKLGAAAFHGVGGASKGLVKGAVGGGALGAGLGAAVTPKEHRGDPEQTHRIVQAAGGGSALGAGIGAIHGATKGVIRGWKHGVDGV